MTPRPQGQITVDALCRLAGVSRAGYYRAWATSAPRLPPDTIEFGDTEAAVIAKMGIPSVKESKETPFYRYATNGCAPPCVYRLWFENRLALDLEAWSISLGTDGRVVGKYHWVSP